ncbi:transport and Golgi organization protein 2 [Copidosoma floridanum]|uniref:transport and Golgi organization protein 2 n=1 Tax=Copidosoma floridanum TaxID=29053 RepID=UPI0006C9BF27|nr:transport and Golgi organization protein 2 [Copidosoma floridanum]
MCILFIHRNPEPKPTGYRLILIANRDEYYARPAEPAHHWDDYPGCLGGTDMEPGREGGTWLALNYKTGRVGVILNLNGMPKSSQGKGRGFLVRDYLTTPNSTKVHADELHKYNQDTQAYNPYNLVMVDLRSSDVYYLSSEFNCSGQKTLHDDVLGFGNSSIERPYQKVLIGKDRFKKIIDNASTIRQEQLIEDLIRLLKQEERHLPDNELKKRSPEAFNELSSIFVRHEKEKYGTRTHSIILVDESFKVTFVEETMMEDGTWKCQVYTNNLN